MLDTQGNINVKQIREILENYLGKNIKIKCNLGRNKTETYDVKIKSLYSYIFLTETNDENHIKKSFSYTDIITKTIKIYIDF